MIIQFIARLYAKMGKRYQKIGDEAQAAEFLR